MARSRRRTPVAKPRLSVDRSRAARPTLPPGPADTEATAGFTGKYLVLLRDDGAKERLDAIKRVSGLRNVVHASDYAKSAVDMAEVESADVFFLDQLKVAVVDADPTQLMGLRDATAEDGAIIAVEPEQVMYALAQATDAGALQLPLDYLRGYRDAVNQLYTSLRSPETEAAVEGDGPGFVDNAQFTWGLQASRVSQSRFSGRDVRVAVLDTGFNLAHPDFVGRVVVNQSFVDGQAVEDLNGHGTHCIGTSLGAQQPAGAVRRYGCAFPGEVFVGKVLSNSGSGADRGILAGINWAIANQCRVISMSLGAPVGPGETFSPIYEIVAQRALSSSPGTLIVAAAGNDSRIPGTNQRVDPPRPVGRPANCPSILAVGAVDANLRIGVFSNGGVNPQGGGVDIAGPGVSIFSSVPDPFPPSVQPVGGGRPWPPRYHTISGTSMATPHVAGIAALWLEARGPNTSARELWQLLTGNARRLSLPSRDVGAGLVQAPI